MLVSGFETPITRLPQNIEQMANSWCLRGQIWQNFRQRKRSRPPDPLRGPGLMRSVPLAEAEDWLDELPLTLSHDRDRA